MRKMRLPVSLKEATWMITESASTTKTPPMSGRSSSFLVSSARVPRAPPSASEPDVAHEDPAGIAVEPEEAEAGADQRAAEDGELAGALDVEDRRYSARSSSVAGDVGDDA